MTIPTTFLPLRDGTQIAVPDDPTRLSHFVLSEQGDWFEDEIHFVRSFIQPGMQVLDIGANYGVYTSAILQRLQGKGHVWCFEPTPLTAATLRQTLLHNGVDPLVTLVESGLSDHRGSATFYTSANSELNSLSKPDDQPSEEQTIQLRTLDDCLDEFAWPALDFIKLDAEGEEVRILQAGQRTLGALSPLVMFELKHGGGVNTALVEAFRGLGYATYRLVPGLNALLPIDSLNGLDAYQLNLFACKAERAQELAARNLLITETTALPTTGQLTRHQFPYLSQFERLRYSEPSPTAADQRYFDLLAAYMASRDQDQPVNQRYGHLRHAMNLVLTALQAADESAIERLSSFARVAFDFGERRLGVGTLEFILKRHFKNNAQVAVRDVFVPPVAETEALRITSNPVEWLCAGILDAMIRKHGYSCYFSGAKMIPLMQNLEQSPYLHPDIAQRIQAMKNAMKAAQLNRGAANNS
jgi:FkbM family methyltransferase